MARHKNGDWQLPEGQVEWSQASVAVLMDVRDELQELNRMLRCARFLRMSTALMETVDILIEVKSLVLSLIHI